MTSAYAQGLGFGLAFDAHNYRGWEIQEDGPNSFYGRKGDLGQVQWGRSLVELKRAIDAAELP